MGSSLYDKRNILQGKMRKENRVRDTLGSCSISAQELVFGVCFLSAQDFMRRTSILWLCNAFVSVSVGDGSGMFCLLSRFVVLTHRPLYFSIYSRQCAAIEDQNYPGLFPAVFSSEEVVPPQQYFKPSSHSFPFSGVIVQFYHCCLNCWYAVADTRPAAPPTPSSLQIPPSCASVQTDKRHLR